MRKLAKKQQSQVQTIQRTVPSRNATQDNDNMNKFWKAVTGFAVNDWGPFVISYFILAQKYGLLQSNNCLLGRERVVETREEFHFSWFYIFSALLSSLLNWANHDRYRLRPSTPARLCWSSSRPQPLQQIWPYWITTVSAMNLKSL